MSRWAIEISDLVTGTLVINGQSFVAGIAVTEDPAVVAYIAGKNSRFYSARELTEGEEVKEEHFDSTPSATEGALTSSDIKAPAEKAEKRECGECHRFYVRLEEHGNRSGHDVQGGGVAEPAAEDEGAPVSESESEAELEAEAVEAAVVGEEGEEASIAEGDSAPVGSSEATEGDGESSAPEASPEKE